jgi:exodeoxyribonuclease VII small subunit
VPDAAETPADQPQTFDEALAALEQCVRQLDGGTLGLEESLRVFERGVALQRTCQELLDATERRIEELSVPSSPAGEG